MTLGDGYALGYQSTGIKNGRHPLPRGNGSGISVFTGESGRLADARSHSLNHKDLVDTHRIAGLRRIGIL
uniref:hypothetical protein n=1 Tax=Orrella sp. TaxID=1921583 RepID=UPI0040481385